DLRRMAVDLGEATGADQGTVAQRDEEHGFVAEVGCGDEVLGVGHTVRMRNACRILGDAAVVRQHCDRFSVPKPRLTQNQPLGLEDGDTSFAKLLRGYFLKCHGTGSFEMLKGETVSVSPLKSPLGPAGSEQTPADPLWFYRLTLPQPPPPEGRR